MVRGITPYDPGLQEGGVSQKSGPNQFGDVAYTPGSGPVDKFCSGCDFMVHSRGAKMYGRCTKVAELRHLEYLSEVGYIDRGTRACKFFIDRPAGKRPWDGLNDKDDVGNAGSEGSPGEPSEAA